MVTFYKVNPLSWAIGKMLVKIPFYCMVNLIAGRKIVPEVMQTEMTGENLAAEAEKLLADSTGMRTALREIREKLSSAGNAIQHAADVVIRVREANVV
jgi:lipid-A-disaccharide synthase